MDTEQIKQAYITSVAARGVLRYKALQKQAMMKQAGDIPEGYAKGKMLGPGGGAHISKTIVEDGKPVNKYDLLNNGYVQSMGTSGGLGAILGAIINGARGKSILNGALIGGGLGLGLGAGHQALYDTNDWYHVNNPFSWASGNLLQSIGSKGQKAWREKNPQPDIQNAFEIWYNTPESDSLTDEGVTKPAETPATAK